MSDMSYKGNRGRGRGGREGGEEGEGGREEGGKGKGGREQGGREREGGGGREREGEGSGGGGGGEKKSIYVINKGAKPEKITDVVKHTCTIISLSSCSAELRCHEKPSPPTLPQRPPP